ncbi:MAG TPA: protease pro-enzyme activation domain-containing protein [Acidobacteriaceae bacterium]|nr:protease pro-enzyme activation domain-containing protein [Acidobacteriaceae bacterium]
MPRISSPRVLTGLTTALFLVSLAFGPVAFAANQNRISGNIIPGNRAAISNSVQPHVRVSSDLGPTPGETKLTGMSLRFSMTDTESAALDQLLADQQNPASPRYHQWLTPAEFGAQFGLSQADITKVTDWLTAQGFTVTGVANGGTYVTFDGTVAQAETAFGTSIHNVTWNGENHFANVSNATVPAALAGVVGGIEGLHNFHVRPHVRAIAHPQFTSSVSGSHYLAPGDVYAMYDVEPLLTNGFTGGGIGTGANCHSVGGAVCGDIAVVGQVDLANNGTADVLAFRTAAGLSTTSLPTVVHANGVDPGQAQTCNGCFPNSGDLQESSLDVEWSGAMAPGASILFVNARCALPGSGCGSDAMSWAIDNNLAPIITSSYGNCEAAWGTADIIAGNTLFKQAAAQGQTIIASAGDAGSTDCDAGISAIEGLTVDFPASSPYVLAMGGTMLNEGSATGGTTYWLGTDTTFSAGSTVPNADVSAKSYIPEAAWDEDSAGSTFSATGGGVSAFFSKPAWQVETGAAGMTTSVPPDSSRDVPDISLDAAAVHDPLLFCYSGSCAVGFRQSAGGTVTVAGGTSFDSQMFGGMLALVEQKIGSRIGLANPTLYAMGNNAAYYSNSASTSVFHDVTAGSNSNPCTAGTPNCPNGGNIGYSATTGYDLATGWGSVDLSNLATDWKLVTPLGTGSTGTNVSSTALTTSPACSGASGTPCTLSLATGSSVTLTATVTGNSAGTPTGTVQFLDNNAALGSPVALNTSGAATYTFTASCAALGQQSMSAVYSGDSNYAGSKGPAPLNAEAGLSGGAAVTSNGSVTTNPLIVTVTSSSCPDYSVAANGSSTSTATIVASGSNATVNVAAGGAVPPIVLTVAPANGFAGTVTFNASIVSTSGFTPVVTFNPARLTFSGSSSSSQTTTVNLSGITASLHQPALPGKSTSSGREWYAAGSSVAVAGLFLIFVPQRRRLGSLLIAVLAIATAAGMTGCGGSSGQPSVGTGNTTVNPYIGTYTVTVQATFTSGADSTTHSSVLTYNIQ